MDDTNSKKKKVWIMNVQWLKTAYKKNYVEMTDQQRRQQQPAAKQSSVAIPPRPLSTDIGGKE